MTTKFATRNLHSPKLKHRGDFSGVVWFDLESGRAMESNTNHDFTVAYKSAVVACAKPVMVTDRHHQVVTTRLVSARGAG